MHRPVQTPEYCPGTGRQLRAVQKTQRIGRRKPIGMKTNLRTAALLAAGVVSAGSVGYAEEAPMNPVNTALTATTISGYVSTTALFDLGSDDGGSTLPGRSFDGADKMDKINLDVVKLTIERPLDEGDWAAGYKVDLLFGPDANTLATSSVLGANDSDFGIKQAYVALQTPMGNDLIAKVGVFDTIVGYEVFESGNNPNYSRSYAYYIEPTQHTGLLLSYQLTEWLGVNAGIANAWNARINAPGVDQGADRDFGLQTYLGSLVATVPDSAGFLAGTAVYGGIVHGLAADELQDGGPRTSYYAGVTIPTPVENLGVGFSFDYLDSEAYVGAGLPNQGRNARAFGGYLSYQLAKQAKVSLRGEYAKGTSGTWVTENSGAAFNDELFGLTTTLDYDLWANVLTRLEFRWDHDLSDGPGAFGGQSGGSYMPPVQGASSGGTGGGRDYKDNAYTIALNFIYKF